MVKYNFRETALQKIKNQLRCAFAERRFSMKNRILPLILCLLITLVSACSSKKAAEPLQSQTPTLPPKSDANNLPEGSVAFDVVNMIGGDINYMYVKPSSADEFIYDDGHDILKKEVLKNGDRRTVSFVPEEDSEYWDLCVKSENNNLYTWYNIGIGTFSEITLSIGDEGPEFTTAD